MSIEGRFPKAVLRCSGRFLDTALRLGFVCSLCHVPHASESRLLSTAKRDRAATGNPAGFVAYTNGDEFTRRQAFQTEGQAQQTNQPYVRGPQGGANLK